MNQHHNLPSQDNDHHQDDDHSHHANPIIHWFQQLLAPHAHGHHTAAFDTALASDRGIWALKISFTGLMVTAILQVFVVILTNSVALFADTIHNFSDALTAIPLGLAFTLARRARNRRYTYGYGRAEDLAGMIIVLMIAFSAVEVFYESIKKLITPEPVVHLGWLAAAAIIGFLGNEMVALFRIRVGKEIGSAALIADGYHARTDGLTSLGVLAGAVGIWIGFPLADPIIGILIGITILIIVWGAAKDMWYRMMDAVDPALYTEIEHHVSHISGVNEMHGLAVRWMGHRLRSELHITVDCKLPTYRSHQIAEYVRHAIFHAFPAMVDVIVHVDPCECDPAIEYHPTAHHFLPDPAL